MSKNLHKTNKKNLFDKYLQEIGCQKVLSNAYESIRDGYKKSRDYIANNPYEFLRKSSMSDKYNSMIVAEFCKKAESDFKISTRIFRFTASNMVYFLLDNKVLFCFKGIDEKDKIGNRDSKRHRNVMSGDPVFMNKRVVEILSKRGIIKQPPIYYFGYHLPKNRELSIKCVRYENNEVAFSLDLREIFFKKEGIKLVIKNTNYAKNKKEVV